MSAAFKLVSLASGLSLVSYSALHTFRTPKQDFSKNALAIEHTLDTQTSSIVKPKLPSNLISYTIGGYKFGNVA